MPPRALIFDGFGTLLTTQPEGDALKEAALRRAHAECDALVKLPPFTDFHAAYKQQRAQDHADQTRIAHKEFNFEARMERAMRALGLGQRQARVAGARAAARYLRELGNATRLMPDADGILNRVPESCKLALASNFPSGPALRTALERLDLLYRFDHLAISGEVGFLKPHPAVISECLEALDIPAEAAVMIGDNHAHDCTPAKALGLRTILVAHPRGSPPSVSTPDADVVIGTLHELPLALSKM